MDSVAACSWVPGRLDVFWVDGERGLWHRAWVSGTWQEPESLGGRLASGPAVTAGPWASWSSCRP